MTRCRHCNRNKGNPRWHRGLCEPCYADLAIRWSFPITSKYGLRSDVPTTGLTMPVPTSATPGSAEKLAVLIERAAAGQRLHHPADVRLETGHVRHDGPRVRRVVMWS